MRRSLFHFLTHLGIKTFASASIGNIGIGFDITGVAATFDGDFYLSGLYNDSELVAGDTTLGNAGGFDSYLMRGNVGGGRKWIRSVGGPGNEAILGGYYGQSLDLDAKGNLYASGAYIGGMQIDGNIKLGSGLLVGKLKQETSAAKEPTLVDLDFGLLPNPTSGAFQVVLGEKFAEFHTLVLHDAQGREVLRQAIGGSTVQVEQPLVSGLYAVSLVGEGQVARKKLLKIYPQNDAGSPTKCGAASIYPKIFLRKTTPQSALSSALRRSPRSPRQGSPPIPPPRLSLLRSRRRFYPCRPSG